VLRLIGRAWRGEEPLWRVVWVYCVSGILGVALLFYYLAYLAESPTYQNVLDGVLGFISIFLWLTLALCVFVWSVVAIWRSAGRSRPLIRYFARVCLVAGPPFAVWSGLWSSYNHYIVLAKVSEATSISSPHRTAVGIACSEGLRPGMSHDDLGLPAPGVSNGPYTTSVEAIVDSETTARVIIVLKEIAVRDVWLWERRVIKDGDTLVYRATCNTGGTLWDVVADPLPSKYRQRWHHKG